MAKRPARLKELIFKQYDTGYWLGAYKDTYGRSLSYLSMMQFFMISGMAYFTPQIEDARRLYFGWVSFPIYLIILLLILLAIQLFVLKIEIPSSVSWGNRQTFIHQNLIKRQLEKQEKRYNKKLNRLEATVRELIDKTNLRRG